MKQFLSSLILIVVVLLAGCSKVPENTDPVLGIWYKTASQSADAEEVFTKEEWIFNDAYLGRYRVFDNNSVIFSTDFQWAQISGLYTISYPGTELPAQNARMVEMDEQEVLKDDDGHILALRQ